MVEYFILQTFYATDWRFRWTKKSLHGILSLSLSVSLSLVFYKFKGLIDHRIGVHVVTGVIFLYTGYLRSSVYMYQSTIQPQMKVWCMTASDPIALFKREKILSVCKYKGFAADIWGMAWILRALLTLISQSMQQVQIRLDFRGGNAWRIVCEFSGDWLWLLWWSWQVWLN